MANANHTVSVSVLHTCWNLSVRSAGHLKPNWGGSRLMFAAVICSLGTAAYADLPLTLEEVIAKKDEVTVELGFNYGNLYTSDFVEEVNQDILSMSLGVRYGMTPTTEIYGSVRGAAHQSRSSISKGRKRNHVNGVRWKSLNIGINHRFSPDNETPALLGYLQTEAIENASPTGKDRPISWKTWSAGIITYRRIDPVVFSLSSGFRYSWERNIGKPEAVSPGSVFHVAAKLNLALNAETSVFWGARWAHNNGKRVGGEAADISATQTSLLLGAAYAVTKRSTLHFDLSADISGRGGANMGTLLRHTF